MRNFYGKTILSILALLVFSTVGLGQTSDFTYQGSLKDGGSPANGNYDFEIKLYNVLTGGAPIGTRTRLAVPVTNGAFSVKLDFLPAAFNGADRFLEIGVKPAGSPDPFTPLSPRQQITYTPYAFRSLNATNADDAARAEDSLKLGGIAANQYVLTGDARLSDARNPLPGSVSYIQSRTTLQPGIINFNISGDGTLGGTLLANTVNAATQYNIGFSRVLSIGGSNNIFAGSGSGLLNSGSDNAFFGRNAGNINTTGSSNSFFGSTSGSRNMQGQDNTFIGNRAGLNNAAADNNTFVGSLAGESNTIGSENSFFGKQAGQSNTGSFNSFFGSLAGRSNTDGVNNASFGYNAGSFNSTGDGNAFFGAFAGQKTNSSNNAFFGLSSGKENLTGSNNAFFGADAGHENRGGINNTFFGYSAGYASTQGNRNTFVGREAGTANGLGNDNTFIGNRSGFSNTQGDNNTIVGSNANVGVANLNFATAIGAGASVSSSNTVVLGRFNDDVRVPGNLIVETLGGSGTTPLCRNAGKAIATCPAALNIKDKAALANAEKMQQTEIEQLRQQVAALKKLVCLSSPNAEICK